MTLVASITTWSSVIVILLTIVIILGCLICIEYFTREYKKTAQEIIDEIN